MNPNRQVVKVHHDEQPCCQISRTWPANPKLSAKAKGIMAFCLTRKASEVITVAMILKGMSDGEKSIRSGFRELSQHGYAELVPTRGRHGRVTGSQWRIYETPHVILARSTEMPKKAISATEMPKKAISEKGYLGESLFPDIQ